MRSITTPRFLIFGCATLSALLLGIATASADATLEKIKRTGVMTSANTFSYPPFGFIEDGKQVGFDVDLGGHHGGPRFRQSHLRLKQFALRLRQRVVAGRGSRSRAARGNLGCFRRSVSHVVSIR